jgi:hypothetical protein
MSTIRYTLASSLGNGGIGRVWLTNDPQFGRCADGTRG